MNNKHQTRYAIGLMVDVEAYYDKRRKVFTTIVWTTTSNTPRITTQDFFSSWEECYNHFEEKCRIWSAT
jgi:hypothetical protein